MADPAKIPIRASTQEHLEIEDIQDDLVILKDGSCSLLIAVTTINFDLLSEREQDATIYAYAGLLNSLTFPIQVSIRSQRKDVSSYLKLLEEVEAKTIKPEIRQQIKKYHLFIQETVQKNNVLDKDFYIVIPMSILELGVAKTITTTLRQRRGLPFDKQYLLERAKVNLYPKRDHLLRLLSRLGLRGKQVTTQELIQLFFNIYNPESAGQQTIPAEQYKTPLVQAAIVKTQPEQKTTQDESSVQNQISDLIQQSTNGKNS